MNYDHMVEKTDLILKNLSKFLNTKKDNKTDLIINRENGNRKINIKDRLKNRNYIQKQISYKYIKIFNYLEKIYEKKN